MTSCGSDTLDSPYPRDDVVCCHVQLFVIPWTGACQGSLSFSLFWTLLKVMSIESMMLFNRLILSCSLLPLLSVFSQHLDLFQWVGSSHQVARVLELQLKHQSLQLIIQGWDDNTQHLCLNTTPVSLYFLSLLQFPALYLLSENIMLIYLVSTIVVYLHHWNVSPQKIIYLSPFLEQKLTYYKCLVNNYYMNEWVNEWIPFLQSHAKWSSVWALA